MTKKTAKNMTRIYFMAERWAWSTRRTVLDSAMVEV
jgi:hypothetical protein